MKIEYNGTRTTVPARVTGRIRPHPGVEKPGFVEKMSHLDSIPGERSPKGCSQRYQNAAKACLFVAIVG